VIEAIFDRDGKETLIRREVTAQGRSRAFVDDELVTASTLKDLAAQLLELHGQHEHHTLLDPGTHLAVLDGFAGSDGLPEARDAYALYRRLSDQLEKLHRINAERSARQDLLSFQVSELNRAALKPDEDQALAASRTLLANAERVERLCAEAYASLYESDDALLTRLSGVWRRVSELAAIDSRFQPYLDTRETIKSQLEDLAIFLRQYSDTIDASPERLQEVEERLALIERLKRKHGPSLGEVLLKQHALQSELEELSGTDERIAALDREVAEARRSYVEMAGRLSTGRRLAAEEFSKALERLLAELAMDRTSVEVRFNREPLPESDWSAEGFDRVEFFVSPNIGEELRPLARIVSGGELSRIMLAIKTLTFKARHASSSVDARFLSASERPGGVGAPGMIFDEVDAGIGGRVAEVVGRKLHALASGFQVLCITHLPQIAAFADAHFAIEKNVDGGRTRTSVVRLDDEGRVGELARMLGGESVTDHLRASAREMLAQRLKPGVGGVSATHPAGESKSKGESERAKAKRSR
jgi:DNA repair protein RecN (Recombination protein N)